METNFEDPITSDACLRRAKQLLSQGYQAPLHQIALELRLCLELAIYAKVKIAAKYVPPSALSSWQPAHALKALVQLDAYADQDFVLSVSEEAAPGVPTGEFAIVGEHKTYRLDWLKKHYNKLGSYLHGPMPGSSPINREDRHAYLVATAHFIEETQKGSIHGFWMSGQTHSIECIYCSQKVVASNKFVELHGFAECLNPACSAQYSVRFADGESVFEPKSAAVECKICGAKNDIHKRHFDGGHFVCVKCNADHTLRPSRWEYGVTAKTVT